MSEFKGIKFLLVLFIWFVKQFVGQKGLDSLDKIKKLENDLKVANEVAGRLTKELEEANSKLKSTKKAPLLGSLQKLGSGEVSKVPFLYSDL